MKTCRKCNKEKELSGFPNRSKGSLDGKQSYCTECFRVTNRAYSKTDAGIESNNKRVKKWIKSNKTKHAVFNRKSQKRYVKELYDSYVIKRIKGGWKMDSKIIQQHPQLIEAAREKVRIVRFLNQNK